MTNVMTVKNISNNVQALLSDMKNASNTGLFVTVQPSPEKDNQIFAGFPSATHFYHDTENGYATVSQNRRVLEYHVYFYVISNEDEDVKWTRTTDMMDAIVDMFDHSIDLSSAALSLPPACDIMRPAGGRITKTTGTAYGEGLVGEVILYCEADITFRDA